jgi:hypothetical protein
MLAIVMVLSVLFQLLVFACGYLVGRSHEPDYQTVLPTAKPPPSGMR